MKTLRKLMNDESGATAIEYGLIAGIVAVGLIAGLTTLKNNLSNGFNAVGATVANNVK